MDSTNAPCIAVWAMLAKASSALTATSGKGFTTGCRPWRWSPPATHPANGARCPNRGSGHRRRHAHDCSHDHRRRETAAVSAPAGRTEPQCAVGVLIGRDVFCPDRDPPSAFGYVPPHFHLYARSRLIPCNNTVLTQRPDQLTVHLRFTIIVHPGALKCPISKDLQHVGARLRLIIFGVAARD